MLWINLSINTVGVEVCAWGGSRLAFILSCTNYELWREFNVSPFAGFSYSRFSCSMFSSPCVDILGCFLKSYKFSLLKDSNPPEKLIQSTRSLLEHWPIFLLREYSSVKFTKSNCGLDENRFIKLKGAVDHENRNTFWLARVLVSGSLTSSD